jgi:phospholipid transport system transporter-binding protein
MLALPVELTHVQAPGCLASLVLALRGESGAVVVLQAGALQQFDSSALAVLLALRREAMAKGQTLRIDQMPPRLEVLADLYGIAELVRS